MIRLQFVVGRALSSKAIAWWGAGHFSHVDAVHSDGSLWGARSDWIAHGVPPGFQVRPAFYEKWNERELYSLATTEEEETRFWKFLQAQIGKPYDKTAIWGFAAGRNWRADDSWFCSEVQTAAIEASGKLPVLAVPDNKIMPGTLAIVMSALGAMRDDGKT